MTATHPFMVRLPQRLKRDLRARYGRDLAARFRAAAAAPPADTDWTSRARDASLSLRLSPEDVARVEALAEARGLTSRDAALRLLEALDTQTAEGNMMTPIELTHPKVQTSPEAEDALVDACATCGIEDIYDDDAPDWRASGEGVLQIVEAREDGEYGEVVSALMDAGWSLV